MLQPLLENSNTIPDVRIIFLPDAPELYFHNDKGKIYIKQSARFMYMKRALSG
jgi:hypothetical protein